MAPSDPTFTKIPPLTDLFPSPSVDEWREIAEASLRGRSLDRLTVTTHEGIEIAPLATGDDANTEPGYPGGHPFVRGRTALGPGADGWEVCQRVDHSDPSRAARLAAEDLSSGGKSLWLVINPTTADSDEVRFEDHRDGVVVVTDHDLDPLFELVDLSSTPIHLEAGASNLAVATALVAAARRNGVDPAVLTGSFGSDPIGALAAEGLLPAGIDGSVRQMAELISWAGEHAPGIRTITVDTTTYHMAGATAVQELAYALATAVDYLRGLNEHGIEPGDAVAQIGFRHAIGRDLFMEAAKLRATRRLWSRAAGACGVDESARAAAIHAVASPRGLTIRDPWVNILRTTVGAFAAAVGGADLLTVLPFDSAIGAPDGLARRMAINSQTILREESHIGRVIDPGGGSWYLETLTDRLAEAAWLRFQSIEGAGGMAAALLEGVISEELDRTLADRETALAKGRDKVTGVSSYPNLAEEKLERETAGSTPTETTSGDEVTASLARLFKTAEDPSSSGALVEAAIEAAAQGASIGQLATALRATNSPTRLTPLRSRREAETFEALRDASDEWLSDHGSRPRVFLANMGPIPEHKPRATFATNFFEAGGIEALGNAGFSTADEAADAFAEADTQMAVICSSDARYPEMVPDLARALDHAGARTVLVAGKPGDHETLWRASGVTGFIHMGCDQVRILVDLLQEEGVLHV